MIRDSKWDSAKKGKDMTGILAAAKAAAVTPAWETWLEGHIGLILAALIVVLLWRVGGTILWHLVVVLFIGYLGTRLSNISALNGIAAKVAAGHPVGPTGSSLPLLAIIMVLFIGSAFLVIRSPHSAAHRAARKAASGSGGGGEEE